MDALQKQKLNKILDNISMLRIAARSIVTDIQELTQGIKTKSLEFDKTHPDKLGEGISSEEISLLMDLVGFKNVASEIYAKDSLISSKVNYFNNTYKDLA